MRTLTDTLDALTHKLIHQKSGRVPIHAEDVLAGIFPAASSYTIQGALGIYNGLELYNPSSTPFIDFHRAANPAGDASADYNLRLVNITDNSLALVGSSGSYGTLTIGEAIGPNFADWNLYVVGRATDSFTQIAIKHSPGVVSASNLVSYIRHNQTAKLLQFVMADGVADKTFLSLDQPNGRLFLEDHPLCLRLYGDTNHYIKYANTWAGQSLDGPLLVGTNTTCLADISNWNFRTQNSGDCFGRASLQAPYIVGSSQMRCQDYADSVGSGPTTIRGAGNLIHFNWTGTFQMWVDVTNVKNFVIDHPQDKDKYLIHACIEGPEAAVFYRGQSQLDGGWVEIQLPEYFESLCAEEGRTVQLTAIADNPQDEWCPVLHATYPKNGKFYVGLGSGVVVNDQKFWWQVTAIRKDVPPVNVEPLKDAVEVMGQGPYTYYKEK